MMPSAILPALSLPMTRAGKIDRVALSLITADAKDTSSEPLEALTPTEARLAAMWMEILELERIGINDNFLDVGGDSLGEMRLLWRLRQEFNISLPTGALTGGMTIRVLGTLIDRVAGRVEARP